MGTLRWVFGVAGGSLAAVIFSASPFSEKSRIDASWTTNFSPSVQWDSNWDRREPASLVKRVKRLGVEEDNAGSENVETNKPTAARHLILIRHGQYVMNGLTDYEKVLTPLGEEQAHLTGKRLKELGFSYTRLVHSTMTRAKETAQIICKYLPEVPVDECSLLREGAPIPPEPPVGHWKPEMHQFYEDGARIEAAFRKYFHRAMPSQKEDSFEILVCHGNVIRYFVLRALQLPPEAWLRFMLFNCSITSVTIRPSGKVFISAVGDSGHLPPDKLTTS